MLQKISHNGTHRDIFADTRDSGFQTTDPPHDQFDLYPRRGSLVQRHDDIPVTKGVHLRNDMAVVPFQRVIPLPAYQ